MDMSAAQQCAQLDEALDLGAALTGGLVGIRRGAVQQ
jgi:hypothetical protein